MFARARILVISPLGLWNYGPRWEVYSRIVRSGYEIHYISPFNEEKTEKIFVHKVNTPLFEKIRGSLQLLSWFLYMISSFKKGLEISKRNRPHIIYGHGAYGALQAYILSKIFRIPLLLRFHGTILYPYIRKKILFKRLDHVIAYKVPADFLIITNDGTYGNFVARCLKVPEKKIKFWMNGVDKDMHPTTETLILKDKLGIPMDSNIVISTCRLIGWKRVDRLIKAIPYIVEKSRNVFFVIVGEGPLKEELKALANKLNVSNYVKFVGHIPHEDIVNYLAIADVYVTMQDLSCLSASLMEAMVCGKCIVALNTGDTSSVIKNGENGILLNYSKLSSLSSLLIDLLNNEEYRKTLANNVRQYAINNFLTWDERTKEELKVIAELLRARRS